MTIREHDLVVLTADIPAEGLEQGDVGTVVLVHRADAGLKWSSLRSPVKRSWS